MQRVKQAKKKMVLYSNCLRCAGVVGFAAVAALMVFEAVLIVPGFPSGTSDASWIRTGNGQVNEAIRNFL